VARAAVLSDIHGNMEALTAVLEAAAREGVDAVWHLGDLVGYNADPDQCMDVLRDRNAVGVQGNHDLAAVDPQIAQSFNVLAHEALLYTLTRLHSAHVAHLYSLPLYQVVDQRVLLCHGTPETPHSYILTVFQAKRTFNLLRKKFPQVHICFHGHTHVQRLWARDPRGKVAAQDISPREMRLDPELLYLINPGSVGQPRQKDRRAHFLIFDTERLSVTFRAVEYDVAAAQRKIRRAGLPEYLALRLDDGI